MIPVARNRSAIVVAPIDRYIAIEVYIAVKRCRIGGYISYWTIGNLRRRGYTRCKGKRYIIVSILSGRSYRLGIRAFGDIEDGFVAQRLVVRISTQKMNLIITIWKNSIVFPTPIPVNVICFMNG